VIPLEGSKLTVSLVGSQVNIQLENQQYALWSCSFDSKEIGEKTNMYLRSWSGLKNFFEKILSLDSNCVISIHQGSNNGRILKCSMTVMETAEFDFILVDEKVSNDHRFDRTLQDLRQENAQLKGEIKKQSVEITKQNEEIRFLKASAITINSTVAVDSVRRIYVMSKPVISIAVNKLERDSILLIDVLLRVIGGNHISTSGIFRYGSKHLNTQVSEAFIQSEYYQKDIGYGITRQMPLRALIIGHREIGEQILELIWSQSSPFSYINPNEADTGNLKGFPTCSIIQVSELRSSTVTPSLINA